MNEWYNALMRILVRLGWSNPETEITMEGVKRRATCPTLPNGRGGGTHGDQNAPKPRTTFSAFEPMGWHPGNSNSGTEETGETKNSRYVGEFQLFR